MSGVEVDGLATPQSLLSLLRQYAGSRAAVLPLVDATGRSVGNNGDRLMQEITSQFFKSAGVALRNLDRIPDPDCIFIPPNGALVEVYKIPGLVAQRLASFRDVPLVILPSSAWFPTKDPSRLFEKRGAETIWILREPASFDHLARQWGEQLTNAGVRLILDHDVVVTGREFLAEELGEIQEGNYLLSVARRDGEGPRLKRPLKSSTSRRWLSGVLSRSRSGQVMRRIYRWRFDSTYASISGQFLEDLSPESQMHLGAFNRVVSADISDITFATYDQYKRFIRCAGAVYTDRLHVALPSALVGKPVVLRDAGYHKLSSVYWHSLADLPNVRFVSLEEAP